LARVLQDRRNEAVVKLEWQHGPERQRYSRVAHRQELQKVQQKREYVKTLDLTVEYAFQLKAYI